MSQNLCNVVQEIHSDDDLADTLVSQSSDSVSNNESTSDYECSQQMIEEVIYPGLVLKSDYILLRKIGQGRNAYVWMVYQISTCNYLAIKIQNYEGYDDGCKEVAIIKKINSVNINDNIYCVKMLDYFVYQINDTMSYVCTLYDLYAGDIGKLIICGKYKYGLPLKIVKQIITQLLKCLCVLHDKLGIIHTDIKPRNILFKGITNDYNTVIQLFTASKFAERYQDLQTRMDTTSNDFAQELEAIAIESVRDIAELQNDIDNEEEFSDNDSDGELITDDGDYDSCSDYNSDSNSDSNSCASNDSSQDDCDASDACNQIFNTRKQSIVDLTEHLLYTKMHDIETESGYSFTTQLNNCLISNDKQSIIDDKYVQNCEIALTDFGNSYFYNYRTKNEIQDRLYRAPEVILDLNYGYSCDIWSLGCVLFELATGYVLFHPLDGPLTQDIHQLFLFEKILGIMPISMKKASKRAKFLFDADRDYHIKNIETFQKTSLKEKLMIQFLFSEADATQMSDFLLCCFAYNPKKRHTASQLLNHEWLKNTSL